MPRSELLVLRSDLVPRVSRFMYPQLYLPAINHAHFPSGKALARLGKGKHHHPRPDVRPRSRAISLRSFRTELCRSGYRGDQEATKCHPSTLRALILEETRGFLPFFPFGGEFRQRSRREHVFTETRRRTLPQAPIAHDLLHLRTHAFRFVGRAHNTIETSGCCSG